MTETKLARNVSSYLFVVAVLLLDAALNKVVKCEEDDSLSPLCNTVIVIDKTRGKNCSAIIVLQTAGYICNNLQEVLMFFSNDSSRSNINCTEIVLSEGNYLIEDNTNIVISHNLYLHSNDSNAVSIELQALTSVSNYVQFKFALHFRDSDFAIIQGIHFTGSKSGVIGFDNVLQVGVTKSTFQ